MKRFFILLSVLALSVGAFATGQDGDVIYINGEKWQLLGKPIVLNRLLFDELKKVLPENRDYSTANWDGYTAFWSIKKDMLYLDSIMVEFSDKYSQHPRKECLPATDLRRVFKDFYKKKHIVATWINSNVRVAKGRMLLYEHMAYERNYEQEQIYTIKEGKVLGCQSYQNGIAVEGFYLYRAKDKEIKEKLKPHFKNYPELDSVKTVFIGVWDVCVDSLGNLLDCKTRAFIRTKESGTREIKDLSQEVKDCFINIRPWRVLRINGEFIPQDRYGITFPYEIVAK